MKANNEWMSISDMMAGLMMIFLFIAIAFMIEVQSEQDTIKEIAMTYRKSQTSLNQDLHKEFEKDLERWGAEITQDNIFRFKSPEVLFKTGSSEISQDFKEIINDFFPRYLKILTSQDYLKEIDEIRVEGHTSNIWNTHSTQDTIYLKNMSLSQDRANSVLTYCYKFIYEKSPLEAIWLEKKFRANGMAFANPVFHDDGKNNNIKSQRVEFRVLTKAQEKIYKIIEAIN